MCRLRRGPWATVSDHWSSAPTLEVFDRVEGKWLRPVPDGAAALDGSQYVVVLVGATLHRATAGLVPRANAAEVGATRHRVMTARHRPGEGSAGVSSAEHAEHAEYAELSAAEERRRSLVLRVRAQPNRRFACASLHGQPGAVERFISSTETVAEFLASKNYTSVTSRSAAANTPRHRRHRRRHRRQRRHRRRTGGAPAAPLRLPASTPMHRPQRRRPQALFRYFHIRPAQSSPISCATHHGPLPCPCLALHVCATAAHGDSLRLHATAACHGTAFAFTPPLATGTAFAHATAACHGAAFAFTPPLATGTAFAFTPPPIASGGAFVFTAPPAAAQPAPAAAIAAPPVDTGPTGASTPAAAHAVATSAFTCRSSAPGAGKEVSLVDRAFMRSERLVAYGHLTRRSDAVTDETPEADAAAALSTLGQLQARVLERLSMRE